MQLVLKRQELLHLALEQLRNRHAGPAADHFGDIFFIHFFFQHPLAGLLFGQPRLFGFELAIQFGQFSVLELGGAVQIVLALGLLDFNASLFQLFAQATQTLHGFLLSLPLGFQGVRIPFQIGQLFFDFLQTVLGSGVGFLLQRLALDLELHDASKDLI